MAPGEFAYLDYPQFKGDLPEFNNWGMPVTTLETCYQFDPGYGKPAAEQAHIFRVREQIIVGRHAKDRKSVV